VDHCTHNGAVRLAERIMTFWRTNGYEVRCAVAPSVYTTATGQQIDTMLYGVRSNLVNGLPSRPPGAPVDATGALYEPRRDPAGPRSCAASHRDRR
jgi:hypothetical protein